jgi:hypothetical protein
VTAKVRVLLLPLVPLAFVAAIVAVFYVRGSCAVDGRESFGDKSEWSILQSLEATHRDTRIADLEFTERDHYHMACTPDAAEGKRVWIMLDPRHPPFYKQMPYATYSLSRDQYEKIIATRHVTSTVEEALESHVR